MKSGSYSSGSRLSEATRPVRTGMALDGQGEPLWQLVIAWHPDPTRVGAIARIGTGPRRGRPQRIEIGRGLPRFTLPGGAHCACDDLHVSRSACALVAVAGGWRLCRSAGASRLRMAGRDVVCDRDLSAADINTGFCLSLGDHVLLHLRLVDADLPAIDASQALPDTFIGVGAAMSRLRADTALAAASGGDVLLVGPTGTGKERVARALHDLGPRRSGPWVPVNMAAIPPELAAASLFGARRGAFTGADAHRHGYFAAARGGTLFLDEIGDTPPTLQPLLLRALQEREIQVLGGDLERVDLTVVSAMEHDPDDPALGFRRALRFRLGAQEIRLPPLVQRAEDIGPLVRHFLAADGASAALLPAPAAEQPRWLRLLELLLINPWPGNVRELQHTVGQLVAASRAGSLLVPPRLLDRLRGGAGFTLPAAAACVVTGEGVAETAEPSPRRLGDLDEAAFRAAWEATGYEVAAMARRFGVSRAAIYRRLKSTRRCRLAADVPAAELASALDACDGDPVAAARRLAVSRRGLEARLRASTGQASGPDPQRRGAERLGGA